MGKIPLGARAGRAVVTAWLVAVALAAPGMAQVQAADHAAWDRLLQAHVDARGLVDYDAFARNPGFEEYLQWLARADPAALPRAEQLALWINAYNAYTIRLVHSHGERRSIRNINRTLGLIAGKGPWSERMATVGGRTYTLDEIEHEIIRPRFQEPRIHFALVCAAIGCPTLRTRTRLPPWRRSHPSSTRHNRREPLRNPRSRLVGRTSAGGGERGPRVRWGSARCSSPRACRCFRSEVEHCPSWSSAPCPPSRCSRSRTTRVIGIRSISRMR
jgi:hypothetical protein